jgi:hypothetical protein
VLLRSTTSAGTIPKSFSRKTEGLKGHPRLCRSDNRLSG